MNPFKWLKPKPAKRPSPLMEKVDSIESTVTEIASSLSGLQAAITGLQSGGVRVVVQGPTQASQPEDVEPFEPFEDFAEETVNE